MAVNVFVDTNIVNRVLDLDIERPENKRYEEDRKYLSKIVENYVENDLACLFVNPSVKQEIENTADVDRRGNLIEEFNEFEFTPYNATVFPFEFPANFPEKGESDLLETILDGFPEFRKDQKIFLDALSNSKVEILLTTDREHFLEEKVDKEISQKELEEKLKIFTPKELFEYLDDKF